MMIQSLHREIPPARVAFDENSSHGLLHTVFVHDDGGFVCLSRLRLDEFLPSVAWRSNRMRMRGGGLGCSG